MGNLFLDPLCPNQAKMLRIQRCSRFQRIFVHTVRKLSNKQIRKKLENEDEKEEEKSTSCVMITIFTGMILQS